MQHPRPDTIDLIDADEQLLSDVRKHPIGIIILYIQVGLGMILAIGLSYFLLPTVFEDTSTAFFYGNMFAIVAVAIAFLVCLVATHIFWQNRIVITDRNITQTLQYGLFTRKVSQLNISNVEDVTALQKGFLQTTFNYGTLKVETAGEQVNFHFTFCPNVGYHAKIILNARERMLGQMTDASGRSAAAAGKNSSNGDFISPVQAIKELGAETVKQAAAQNDRQ